MTPPALHPGLATMALMLATAMPVRAERPIGFYAPWDAASAASLRDHGDALSVVVPAWFSVTGADHQVTVTPDPAGHAALAGLSRRPKLWLMVQNALLGTWDGAGAAALMRDATAEKALLDRLETEAVKEGARGIVIDFEALPAGSQADLPSFLARVRAVAHAHGWILAVTAPVADPAWNLAALGAVADRVILMAYDEHWQTGRPGPIASDSWFGSVVTNAIARLPPGHAIVGVASYAYDWPAAGPATILSIAQAEALATQHGASPLPDRVSGAVHFSYVLDGATHQVWMADAAVVQRQARVARRAKAAGMALWRLGTEDHRIWSDRQSPSNGTDDAGAGAGS